MEVPMTVMEEFIQYLLWGLETVSLILTDITFDIEDASFTMLDMTAYAAIIGAVLSFISSHFSGAGYGRNKTVSYKARREHVDY